MKVIINPKWNDIGEYLNVYLRGNGFNDTWRQDKNKNGLVRLYMAYSPRNEIGQYEGWARFSISFDPTNINENFNIKLRFHGKRSHYLAKKYFLRCFIENEFIDKLEKFCKRS